MNLKQILFFILIISIFIGGLFVGKSLNKTEIVESIDTLFIPSEPKIIWKTAYITTLLHDTTIINGLDTIFIKDSTIIAKMDTSFDEGKLGILYYYMPANLFRLDWKPNPKEIITITNNIYPKKSLMDNIFIGFGISQNGKPCLNISFGYSIADILRKKK
jgi:hypothetical protein